MRRRGAERWPEHGVPRSSPSGLRGELSGSALGPPSRSSRFAPGMVGPPSSRGRFGHGNDSSEGAAAAMADWSGVRRVSVRVPGSATCSAPRASSASPDRARSSGSRSLRAIPPRWRRRRPVVATRSGRPGTGNRRQDSGDGQPGPCDPGRSEMLIHHVRLQSLVGRDPLGVRRRHRTREPDYGCIPFAPVRPRDRPTAGDARCYHPRSEPVLGPVGMCGFDRAWLPGNASRGRHWASLITWQKEVPGNRQSTLALAA